MSTTPKPILSRPLGPTVETFCYSRTNSGYFRNFQVTAVYSRKLETTHLFFALRKALIDYPLLACNVFKGDQLEYRPIARATLGDFLGHQPELWLENGALLDRYMKWVDSIVFEQHVDKPAIRLIVVGDRTLTVAFDHCSLDGVSGNYIHEVLVENLGYVTTKENAASLQQDYGIDVDAKVDLSLEVFSRDDLKYVVNSLPPPVDHFINADVDYSGGDPDFYTKPPPGLERWPGLAPPTSNDISFKLIRLGPEEVNAILAQCRHHQVTLTSYVTVATAVALYPLVDGGYTVHKTAMTLRRFFDPSLTTPEYRAIMEKPNYKMFGTPVHGGLPENIAPLKEFSWDEVERVNRNLVATCLNRNVLFSERAGYQKIVPLTNNKHIFDANLGKRKSDTVKFSNLGFIKCPDYNGFKLEEMTFSQSMSPVAADLQMSSITTPSGMTIVVSYFENDVPKPLEIFHHTLKQVLLAQTH